MIQHRNIATLLGLLLLTNIVAGQQSQSGFLVNVSLPIDDISERQTIAAVKQAALQATESQRAIVILKFGIAGESGGKDTAFERGLGLARFLTGDEVKQVRKIAYLAGAVEGHAVLPVLACDQIIVSPSASLGSATIADERPDRTIQVSYETIADRRRTIPMGAVNAMVDPSLELVGVNGGEQFLSGEPLVKAREGGTIWKEAPLSTAGQHANFTGAQMRKFRWAAHEITEDSEIAETLGLDAVKGIESSPAEQPKAVLAELIGPINARRIRRLSNNLSDATNRNGFNQVVLVVDSAGGDLNEAARLAGTIAQSSTDGIRTAAFVESRANSDACLVALSARKVYMAPGAVIGGPGDGIYSDDELADLNETINEIGRTTGRSPGLIRALLDPQLQVFKYTDSRTGRTGYFTSDELAAKEDVERWTQDGQISTSEGLSAEKALELGLITGIKDDLMSTCRELGLERTPRGLDERKIVHFVENLARQIWLPRMLLFFGFFMLSVEMGAPGIGVPGFFSLLCFLLFFWIKAAGGTAEWLEIFLFAGGVACIIAEIFVFPGFGVFGLGGLAMLIVSIVLVSQTFVVPQNSYQYAEMTGSLFGVVAALGGVVGGGIALRYMMPQLPFFRHMMMVEDAEQRETRTQREALVNWNHLAGRIGTTTTPLVPAGKAKFGDDIVAVVSNGPMIEIAQPIVVLEVQGNRVIVEEREL